MEFAFPWPMTNGEWMAWGSAAVTVLFGLVLLFLPSLSLRLLRLRTTDNHPEALSEARSTMAGFYLGVGLCCILLAQPLLYLALGFSWLFTAFGRVVSMLSDRGNTAFNWVSVVIELVLATLPLLFAFGFVA
jgi:cytochrome c biogenesis protein CcdA